MKICSVAVFADEKQSKYLVFIYANPQLNRNISLLCPSLANLKYGAWYNSLGAHYLSPGLTYLEVHFELFETT